VIEYTDNNSELMKGNRTPS